MIKKYFFLIVFIFPFILQAQVREGQDLNIWFRQPAEKWTEALPVGNGSLGAMVFGKTREERIQLNEETVWTHRDSVTDQPNGVQYLPEIREALFDGRIVEAQEMSKKYLLSPRLPSGTNTYQTLGNLKLSFNREGEIKNYRRELNLNDGLVRVQYTEGEILYTREIFASYPDQVIVIRIKGDHPLSVILNIQLDRPGNLADIGVMEDYIRMSEQVGEGKGVNMEAWVKVLNVGGIMQKTKNGFQVDRADEVILLVAGATDYRGEDPYAVCANRIEKAADYSYEELLKRHIEDYQQLFSRVQLNLGTSPQDLLPADERIRDIKKGISDPSFASLYFQFGRYLLMSSSRPGDLPANLQGIWCEGLTPPWNADYHTNINLQMNYWPAEVTNLSECHEPYFDFVDHLVPNGEKTARTLYGCKGFVVHHTTDVWFPTSPVGSPKWGMWPTGGAWLVRQYWEHYLFTGDINFLRTRAWPIMKKAALFFTDYLVPDPGTGKLVSGPSISPENSYFTKEGDRVSMTMGPAMDQEIIHELFSNCIEASKILKTDKSFRKTLEQLNDNLAPVKIYNGRIVEWDKPYKEAEPGHRHMSHLFALYPGHQFNMEQTPEYVNAAKNTIEYRLQHGGGHTGWSRAWIINFYARLKDGEKAYGNLLALFGKSTLPNLFDTHPPFQIDGNFGGTAGIAEMLLQSHAGIIELLPALPAAWGKGNVTGLLARGGFEVSLNWDNHTLKEVRIKSRLGKSATLQYGTKRINIKTRPGETYSFSGDLKLQ